MPATRASFASNSAKSTIAPPSTNSIVHVLLSFEIDTRCSIRFVLRFFWNDTTDKTSFHSAGNVLNVSGLYLSRFGLMSNDEGMRMTAVIVQFSALVPVTRKLSLTPGNIATILHSSLT